MYSGLNNDKKNTSSKHQNITEVDAIELIKKAEYNSEALASLFIRQKEILKISDEEVKNHLNFQDIADVIRNPSLQTKKDIIDLKLDELDFSEKYQVQEKSIIRKYLETEKKGKIPGINYDEEDKLSIKLENYHIGSKYFDDVLPELLKIREVTKVLIISDTAQTRHLKVYKKIAETLHQLQIPFVEFTNVQPKLNRELLHNMSGFALKHNVNALFVVGCDSTIDLSKILLTKLLKPNSIRITSLHKKPIVAPHFTFVSFPTIVVPDKHVHQQSLLDNSIFFKSKKSLGDTIFLSHPIDSADGVFYHPESFLDFEKFKLTSMLHQIFFRLIFNYFDNKSTLEMRKNLISEIKTIVWYLDHVNKGKNLNVPDLEIIFNIRANSVNGLFFVDSPYLWTWYKMEASLSYLVKSDKARGLALFLPSFLEYLISVDKERFERAKELAKLLYNAISPEGLIYNLIKHNERFGLPTKFLDIKEINSLDYKFLMTFLKNSSNYFGSYKAVKSIIKNLAIW